MEFGDLSENPFARVARKEKNTRRRALVRSFQVFVLVTIATGGIFVLANQSKRWLAGRLLADFDSLGAVEKIDRLSQLAEFGAFSVEPLVNSMADKDPGVARAGYELLRAAQNDWTVLPLPEERSRHELLIESVKGIAIDLPDHRTGWGTSLMQQTLLFASEHPGPSGDLPERASKAISLLALSGRSSNTNVLAETDNLGRLNVPGGPLPVDGVESLDEWTTWPPSQAVARNVADGVAGTIPGKIADVTSGDSLGTAESAISTTNLPTNDYSSDSRLGAVPTVYKSGANRLQLVGSHEVVELADIADSPVVDSVGRADLVEVGHRVHAGAGNVLRAIDVNAQGGLVESPMGTFDDASVMRWLGSPHAALREKAKLELVSRGFDGTTIAIATRIFTGDVNQKLELVEALTSTSVVDPRPWLLLLLQDSDRDVRMRTVSVLGSMDDPAIAGRLRTQLGVEQDPAVASRIRRVLNLR